MALATPTPLSPQLLPATPASPPPPPSASPASPEPPSLLLLEVTPLLDVTLPTLLESSMSPRGRLRLMLRLTPTTPTDTTDSATLDTTVLDTPDSLATPATPTLTTTALATPTTPMPSLPL